MDGMQNIPNTLFQKGKPYAEKEYLSIQKRSLLYHGDPGAGLDGSHQYRSHVRHHHGLSGFQPGQGNLPFQIHWTGKF